MFCKYSEVITSDFDIEIWKYQKTPYCFKAITCLYGKYFSEVSKFELMYLGRVSLFRVVCIKYEH